jgi:hypothetical protein
MPMSSMGPPQVHADGASTQVRTGVVQPLLSGKPASLCALVPKAWQRLTITSPCVSRWSCAMAAPGGAAPPRTRQERECSQQAEPVACASERQNRYRYSAQASSIVIPGDKSYRLGSDAEPRRSSSPIRPRPQFGERLRSRPRPSARRALPSKGPASRRR